MAGPDLKLTLTLAECRVRGNTVSGWCADHGTRPLDLSGPAGRDERRIEDLWHRRVLKCRKCGKPLSAVTVTGLHNAMMGNQVLAEWRME